MNDLKEDIKKIIEEWIIGYCCKECGGGGANGREDCARCKGLGIVDWNAEFVAGKVLERIAKEKV